MIRHVTFLLALALAQPTYAQTAPTAAPKATKPAPTKPAKPVAKKPEPPKPDAAAEHGPCIGVIPHIGETFALQVVGLTMFGNELKEVPIESWGLDDLIVARMRAAAGPRVAARRIAYPANAFHTFDDPPPFYNRENGIREILQSVAPANRCERYVVVIKSGSQWKNTNQSVMGVGIVHSGPIERLSVTYLFATTGLIVFDGHTLEVLKKGVGSLKDETIGERLLNDLVDTTPIHGPSRKLEDFAWPPAPDAVMGLREPTRALLAQSLDKTLPKLLRNDGDGQ